MVKTELFEENVKFITNSFYEVTNSISSIWFARNYLEQENVTIGHRVVVFEDYITENYLVKTTEHPYVLVDSSVVKASSYNTVTKAGRVLVMRRKLKRFDSKCCCMIKLDAVSARLVKKEGDNMINSNMYDHFFEDSLVQTIMFHDFELRYIDVKEHGWSEVDSTDDLLNAQNIQRHSSIMEV